MSDKLEWMNHHLVLLQHQDTASAITKAQYCPPTDALMQLTEKHPGSESYLQALCEQDNHKEACSFLAFNLHKRAAVWWGYRCLLSLQEELKVKPGGPRPIEDIGKPRPLKVPDWAKPLPEPAPDTETPKLIAELQQKYAAAVKYRDEHMPPRLKELFDYTLNAINTEFKNRFGYTPDELSAKIVDRFIKDGNNPVNRESSQIYKARDELKAKIEQVRQETIELVKSALPAQDPAVRARKKTAALEAAYRYILAPDEGNAAAALDAGNTCPDQPEGMLALCAFWSFGNMTPLGKNVIHTPPVLLPNGLNTLLLQLGLAKGGYRKFKERLKLYYELGYAVASGKDLWAAPEDIANHVHSSLDLSPAPGASESASTVPPKTATVRRFTARPQEESHERP